MPQPHNEDFAELDAFLGDAMTGVLDTLEKVFDPSGRLAQLANRKETTT